MYMKKKEENTLRPVLKIKKSMRISTHLLASEHAPRHSTQSEYVYCNTRTHCELNIKLILKQQRKNNNNNVQLENCSIRKQ